MELDQALAVAATQHHAVLSTLRSHGAPQLTPVLVTPDNAGHLVISTTAGTAKVHNLRRDPRAWVCVLPDEFFGRWMQVEGRVEIVTLPEALPLLENYYRSINGEHPNWQEYRDSMWHEDRVVLRFSPHRAVAPTS